jgi:cell division septation protein DedD
MNIKYKQRIVGIIIIAAIIALITPFAFKAFLGEEKISEPLPIANHVTGESRTNVIDLPAPAFTKPVKIVESQPIFPLKKNVQISNTLNNKIKENKVVAMPVMKPVTNSAIKPVNSTPKISIAKTQHLKPVTAQNNKKVIWAINLGGFSDNDWVHALTKKLKAHGYYFTVTKIKMRHFSLQEIMVGKFKTEKEAHHLAKELWHKMKVRGFVVQRKK